jgi:hypothetical protein
MRNGFDAINAKHNEDAFNLYKYSRDSKDELSSEIGELRTELAVLKATRPYQDALIQCDIRRVAEHADFNLWRRTCRMISGEVVLLSESIDNLVVAQVKKYPNVFSGVEIGEGTIKINIPSFDKQLVFDYNDIETFKQNILN